MIIERNIITVNYSCLLYHYLSMTHVRVHVDVWCRPRHALAAVCAFPRGLRRRHHLLNGLRPLQHLRRDVHISLIDLSLHAHCTFECNPL